MDERKKAAAALAGLLALGLGWWATRPAPPTMPQRSPSGRVYLLTRSTAVSFPGGGRGLGVQYLAETSRPQALAEAADEIMTLVSPAAEAQKLRVILVDALVPRRFLPRKSTPAAFGRGEDGIWTRLPPRGRKPAAAEPADLRALDEAYARIERAVQAKDAKELQSLQAEGFWHKLSDGTNRTREEENALTDTAFASIKTIKPVLRTSSISVEDGYAVVVASMTSVIELLPKAGGSRLRSVTVSRDSWLKTDGGWKLRLAADVSDRSSALGR
jgi:hypothetical protein